VHRRTRVYLAQNKNMLFYCFVRANDAQSSMRDQYQMGEEFEAERAKKKKNT